MMRKMPGRLLAVFGGVMILCSSVLLILDAWQEYELELRTLKKTLSMDARLLAEHAQLSFSTARRTLDELEERYRQGGIESFERDKSYWEEYRRRLARVPQLAQVAIIDADGRIRFTSSAFPAPPVDVSDREFFRAHAAGDDFHIGKPILARVEPRRIIPITLRISGPQNEFRGVLFASLNQDYFQEFYSTLWRESGLRIGMIRRDGRVLSLYPPPSGELSTEVQERIGELFADVESGIHIVESPIDGTAKVVAYLALDDFPVAVGASYQYRAFLTHTVLPLVRGNALIFLVLTAVIVFSLLLIRRAMAEAEKARGARQASDELSRAIVSYLPHERVAVFDRERRCVFAEGQVGTNQPTLALGETVGRTLDELYSPGIRFVIEVLVARALAGEQAEAEVSHEGSVYKVIAVPLPAKEDTIRHCMLLTQDITVFKQNQQFLEALCATDSLLGIANRREFDRVLEQEWRRSIREDQPLALLMIDVDSFKLFNDTYGHQAGDKCLQEVAHMLKQVVARPGDQVARYGGEEMAVLLPDTDLDGALRIAEHIHQTLAHGAIPFPESGVADRVTVSIGAASMKPTQDLQPAALIAEADAGVYAAKDAGRNTTCTGAKTLKGRAD